MNELVKVKLNQNQFDALVSFTYNLGPESLKKSTLIKLNNQNQMNDAVEEFTKWVKANGKTLPGLVRRRQAERNLFLKVSSYKIKVIANAHNLRTGPGTNYDKIDLLYKNEIHTIVNKLNSWENY